jgi:hypothetical protein
MKTENSLHDQGYAHLRNVIPPEAASMFLRQLWKDLRERNVSVRPPDKSLLKKHAMEIHGRDHVPTQHLHWGLTSVASAITGADLLPSYAYFRLYVGGDVCRVHSDRPASEYSLSLTLAYSDDKPWGLSIGTLPIADPYSRDEDFGDEPFTTVEMEPGDGLLYQGSGRRHGRVEPNPNKWSAHLFLQWVNRDGPHTAFAFEGMIQPGEKVNFLGPQG